MSCSTEYGHMWTLISHCATVDDVCPVTCGPMIAELIVHQLLWRGWWHWLLCSYEWVCRFLGRFCVQLDPIHFLLRMVRIREMFYSHWFSAVIIKVQKDQQGLYLRDTSVSCLCCWCTLGKTWPSKNKFIPH
jgi:hypothetical protein